MEFNGSNFRIFGYHVNSNKKNEKRTMPRAKSDLNPKDTTTPRAIIIVFK
jgi:hypothetical protein